MHVGQGKVTCPRPRGLRKLDWCGGVLPTPTLEIKYAVAQCVQ
jgi:hypothetical protein